MMTFQKWYYNLKTCVAEFIAIGLFVSFVIVLIAKPNTISSKTYDVDSLIQDYERENSTKIWDYRRKLIKKEIEKTDADAEQAKKIIKELVNEAQNATQRK